MEAIRISLIWAMTRNRVIGVGGRLPWNLPDEMAHFKDTTMGKPVIMGRNTYQSVGHPLPERLNIVLSSKLKSIAGGLVASDLDSALEVARKHALNNDLQEIFVIGGAQVYEAMLPRADRLYATTIDVDLEGDTFFPDYEDDNWQLVESRYHGVDTRHPYSFTIQVFDRKP